MTGKRCLLLLDDAPALAEDMPKWLDSLSRRNFDSVWISAVLSIVHEDYPNAPLGDLAKTLNTVRRRYRKAAK